MDLHLPNPTLALCLGLASMAYGYGRRKSCVAGLGDDIDKRGIGGEPFGSYVVS